MAAQRYLVNVDTLECHTRLSPYQIKLASNVECVFGLTPFPPGLPLGPLVKLKHSHQAQDTVVKVLGVLRC